MVCLFDHAIEFYILMDMFIIRCKYPSSPSPNKHTNVPFQ